MGWRGTYPYKKVALETGGLLNIQIKQLQNKGLVLNYGGK